MNESRHFQRRIVVYFFTIFSFAPTYLLAQESDKSSVNTNANAIDDDSPNQNQTRVSLVETKLKFNELVDELERVPGLSTQQSGLGQPSYAAIRGGNPRQNRVYWNGLKLSLPFGPGFDFSSLDSVAFDSLTVLRSGSSATKGSGALTGAIELDSDGFFTGKIRKTVRTYGTFGTYNSSRKVGVGDGKSFILLTAALRRSDGDFPFIDRQGTPHIRVGNDSQRIQVSTIIGRTLSEKWTNKMSILYSNLDRGSPGPSEFQDLFSNARNKISQVHVSNVLQGRDLDSALGDGAEAKFLLGLSGSDFSYRNPTAFLGNGNFESLTKHRRGSSAGRFRLYSKRSLTTLHLGASFETYQTRTTKNSIEETPTQHERVEASLKTAFEWYWNDAWITFLNGAIDQVDDHFLPTFNIGTSVELLDGLSLRINGARSSRSPDLDELYLETESVRGNPDLDIESAWTADLSVQFQNDFLNLQSTFFASRINNTVLFLPVSSFLIEANNISAFPSFGLENGVELQFKHIDVNAAYTLTSANPSGFQAPHQPLHKGTVGVDLHTKIKNTYIKSARLFANANARSEVNLDLFGSLKNEASLRVNIGMSSRLDFKTKRKIDLLFGVKNIFDNQKQSDFLQRPLSGRQVYGSFQMEL